MFYSEWEIGLFLVFLPTLNNTENTIFQSQQFLTQLSDVAIGFKVLQMDAPSWCVVMLQELHAGNLLFLFFLGFWGDLFVSSFIYLSYKVLHGSTTVCENSKGNVNINDAHSCGQLYLFY